jgi:hypothetical protein
MDNQIANSFDAVTVRKIFISICLSATATLAIALLQYFGSLHIDNPILAMAATFVPVFVNAIKEYQAGISL